MARKPARRAKGPRHIHLPSVHVRSGGVDFDYEMDLFVSARGTERVITAKLAGYRRGFHRVTRDFLCDEELEWFERFLPVLMEEGNPEAEEIMHSCAEEELERQTRIMAGREAACAGCGCSETHSCSGGCIWAGDRLCSRCATASAPVRAMRAGGAA